MGLLELARRDEELRVLAIAVVRTARNLVETLDESQIGVFTEDVDQAIGDTWDAIEAYDRLEHG